MWEDLICSGRSDRVSQRTSVDGPRSTSLEFDRYASLADGMMRVEDVQSFANAPGAILGDEIDVSNPWSIHKQ